MKRSTRRADIRFVWILALTTVIAATALYGVLLAFLAINQRVLVFPASVSQGKSEAQINAPHDWGRIVTLHTVDNVKVFGYFATPNPRVRQTGKTILFFYGNGCYINGCWYIIDHLRNLGCSVLMLDYPGYGMSGGVASDTGCYNAADAAYKYLVHTRRVPVDDLIISGWSLGSSVAIHLAAEHPAGGLITFSAFTSMADMACRQYPIVPEPICKLILRYPFPSMSTIPAVHCPICIVHGEQDTFVPPAMSERLAQAAHAPVTRILVPNVGHNDILSDGGPAMYDKIVTWINHLPVSVH